MPTGRNGRRGAGADKTPTPPPHAGTTGTAHDTAPAPPPRRGRVQGGAGQRATRTQTPPTRPTAQAHRRATPAGGNILIIGLGGAPKPAPATSRPARKGPDRPTHPPRTELGGGAEHKHRPSDRRPRSTAGGTPPSGPRTRPRHQRTRRGPVTRQSEAAPGIQSRKPPQLLFSRYDSTRIPTAYRRV